MSLLLAFCLSTCLRVDTKTLESRKVFAVTALARQGGWVLPGAQRASNCLTALLEVTPNSSCSAPPAPGVMAGVLSADCGLPGPGSRVGRSHGM